MEDDLNERRPKRKTTKMEDDQKWKTSTKNRRRPKWKMTKKNRKRPKYKMSTKIEDDQNGSKEELN